MALPTSVLPTIPAPAEYNLSSVYKTYVSDPIAGKIQRQTRTYGAHAWELELSYNPMDRSAFAGLQAFLEQQRGRHDKFGVLIPSLAQEKGLAPGNLLNASGHNKVYRVVSLGNQANTQLYTSNLVSESKRFSNSIPVTAGVPIAVYFKLDNQSGTYPSVSIKSATVAGTLISDSLTTTDGYQLHILTPTSTDASAYVEISSTANTVTEWSIQTGIQISSSTMTLVPTPLASVENQYLMPAPACVMNCSLDNDVQTIRHGRDRFVRIEVNLIERD